MTPSLCIHGHFYQPPRRDPWLGQVLPEPSAAPGRDWNETIARQCYAPLAWARLLDDQGRIRSLLNAYEYLSFNFGPTLLTWMQHADPSTYARILEGDRASRTRLGFGNAMAQVRHHVIMPLATEQEKRLETAWAVQDFQARFGRMPEGLWLAETAVDTPTLEVLAEAGLAFTVLAPRQAKAVDTGHGPTPVDEGSLDISQPYAVPLPSGRSISVFFYHGALSQAVAFERLLEDGGAFWSRLSGACGPGLTALATDGETYGHHFKFGEMALAWMLEQATRSDITLTNFAAHLAANPPQATVTLHEPSAWSCEHGVDRWQRDCGCNSGGHPGWNQAWRAPLRQSLRELKTQLDAHWTATAPMVLDDPEAALLGYGQVLTEPKSHKDYVNARAKGDPAVASALLRMQHHAQASFASCAWFFDDLDRIEPLGAMANALRAVELARDSGLQSTDRILQDLEQALSKARANDSQRNPGGISGDALFRERIRPRSMPLETFETRLEQASQSPDAPPRTTDLPEGAARAVAQAWLESAHTRQWQRELALARQARELVLPLGESQTTLNEAWQWQRLAPALAHVWITEGGDTQRDEALAALLTPLELSPAQATALSRTLVARVLSLLETQGPDLEAAAIIVERAQTISAPVDWWPVQNRLWELHPDPFEAKRLLQPLGLSPDFLA